MTVSTKVRRLAAEVREISRRRSEPEREGVRVFGVGAAKTGTHSLGQMFEDRVATRHEADAERLISLILTREAGDDVLVRDALRHRDRRRRLKLDASQVNVYLLDDLEVLFPESRYVLTVRSPLPWLRSIIDDSLRRDTSDTWLRFRIHRFGSSGDHPAAERALAERRLFALSGYLRYWRSVIERVVDTIPSDRLLVVRTEDLAPRSAEIAEFCGIAGGAVSAARATAFANPTRFGVLSEVPRGHLIETVERICGDLARTHFPGISIEAEVRSIRG